VDKINKALNSRNRDALFEALYDPKAKYPPVLNFASDLYFEEFAVIREDKGVCLCYILRVKGWSIFYPYCYTVR